MSKIRFIGESDYNFTNGKIYQLIKIEDKQNNYDYFHSWISNDENKIMYIPYKNLATFNENWEVVNE